MSSSNVQVENSNPTAAAGVDLSSEQKTLVGSVLDLFAGKPSKEKLALWSDDATFTDPLTIAQGRKQFEAQWYGLAQVFSDIQILAHQVTSAGNPITLDLRNKYTVKGIGKEQTVQSVVNIYTAADGKIEKLEDKWDGKLPEGSIAQAFRRLNAVSVPLMVSVPKSAEEEKKS